MPPKQRSYPRLNEISHQPTQQTLRLVWDKLHDADQAKLDAATAKSVSDALIAELGAKVDKLTKQITIVAAGGGISPPSTVGGGGSGGTSGGSGGGVPGGGGGGGQPPTPAPGDVPNFAGDVAQAKADLITAGIDIVSLPCGPFEITKLTAWRLGASYPEIGLRSKSGGNNCNGYSTDVIVWRPQVGSGTVVYEYNVLNDEDGAAIPTWSFIGPNDPGVWAPPIPGAI